MILWAVSAYAQQGNVRSTGALTPGHAARWVTNGAVIGDAGGAAGSAVANSGYLTELGITASGLPSCINDALTSSPSGYHRLCFGANALGGGLISYDALGGASPLPLQFEVNGTIIVAPGTITGMTAVFNNAALLAFNHAVATSVLRLGVVTPGDAGDPLMFNYSGSSCADGGDTGFCNPALGGGSWRAAYPPSGADIRQFGAITGTNDTATLQLADTAMGSVDWPSTVAKTVIFPKGDIALYNPHVSNIVEIDGVGNFGATAVVSASNASTGGSLIDYVGVGPFTIGSLAFVCPSYASQIGSFVEPSNCGNQQFYVGTVAGGISTTQISKINGRHLSFIGGNVSARIDYAREVDIEADVIDHPYDHGIIVSSQVNGAGDMGDRIKIHIKRCTGTGEYCASTPVSVSTAVVNYTPRDIQVDIDDCVGAGFILQKGCLDLPHEVVEQIRFNVKGANSYFGVEDKTLKLNNAVTGNSLPNLSRGHHGIVSYMSNLDIGPCLQVPSEHTSPLAVTDFTTNLTFDVTCDFSPPVARLNNQPVVAGQVYHTTTNSPNGSYIVLKDGVTGVSDPTSTATNTGIADGSAIIQYVQQYQTTSHNMIGIILEAISNFDVTLHAHGIGIGYLVSPRGSSDNTMRYGTLKFSGEVTDYCLLDDAGAVGFGSSMQVEHLTLSGFSCVAFGTNSPISIGNSSSFRTIQWDFLKIDGGSFEATDSTVAGALRINAGLSTSLINGTINGARFIGGTSAINIGSGANLNIIGGSLENTAGSAATAGLITSSGAGSGAVTLVNVGGVNTDTSQPSVTTTGGSLAVTGNIINPPVASTPSTHCTPFVDMAYSTAALHLFGCSAGPATWTNAY